MQNRLVSDLYREDLFAALLKEDESIARERDKLIQSLDVYRKAAAILSELRDINFK
jgi:dynamin 1-like protein